MVRPKAVVLLSGGIDSCTTLSLALADGYDVTAITVNYGQKHSIEMEAADLITSYYGIPHIIVRIPGLADVLNSALTGHSELPLDEDPLRPGIPASWVPQRNLIMLAIAAGIAENLKAERIYIGVNQVDYSGYPDCRQEFITRAYEAINMASKRYAETGFIMDIATPIINMTKAEVIKLGTQFKAPLHLTRSCYMGHEKACGRCDSCQIRKNAFKEAGIKDPTQYED